MMAVRPLALGVVGLLAWSWPFMKPGVEVIKVSIPESCADTLNKIRRTADKSDRDVLIWRVVNECGQPVYVSITPSTHPIKCVGEPMVANLGNPFPLGAGKTAYVICAIGYPAEDDFDPLSYPFKVVFQTEAVVDADKKTKATKRMEGTSKPEDNWPRGSELALEVEP